MITVRLLSRRLATAARLVVGKKTEMKNTIAGGWGCGVVVQRSVLLGLLGLAHNCMVRSFLRATMMVVTTTLPLLEPTVSYRRKGRPFKEFIVRSVLPTLI